MRIERLTWKQEGFGAVADEDGEGTFRATEATKLTCNLPMDRAFRVWADVRLGGSGREIKLSLGEAGGVSVSGDRDDEALVHVQVWAAPADEPRGTVELRLRPDVTRWTRNENDRQRFEAEFAELPGWREATLRLALDVTPHQVRAWVGGRFVAAWSPNGDRAAHATLKFGAGDRFLGSGIAPLPDDERFLPVDLAPYHNEACGWASGGSVGAEVLEAEGVPFIVETWRDGRDNINLGKTRYRGRSAYVHMSSLSSDPARALLRVPRKVYDRTHLLCSLDDDPASVPEGAVRFVVPEEARAASSHFTVPPSSDAAAPRTDLVHVVVPLKPGEFQEVLADPHVEALEVDLTRRIALDEDRFPHPAGPPSAVHVHALTLESAPVAMLLTSGRIGHIFEEPDHPTFIVSLTSQRDERQEVRVHAEVTDPYGIRSDHDMNVALEPRAERPVTLDLPQTAYGRFALTVRLTQPDGSRPYVRSTTFAVVPPEARKAMTDSPFGMWTFFEGHYGASVETAGHLLRLAGVRWTLANFVLRSDPEETRRRVATLERYGVRLSAGNVACIHNTCNDGCADVEGMIRQMREMPPVLYWLVFWETSLSREHARALPGDLFGGKPRPLTDDEARALRNCRETAIAYSRRVREEFPDAKLVYGNGFPAFLGELMRSRFPADLIDGFGLDFDLYLSMPELQPGVHYAPFAGLYHLKQFQEMYGYADRPRYLTEAIYCSQADGWLTERQQADYYVRAHLLALASGVVHFGMTAEMWDPGGEYHYSHYGPIGLCHRPPELNPRESFCAYATMTRLLDQAQFDAMLPMPSPSAFGLRFRRANGSAVHAFWTIRGERALTFCAEPHHQMVVTDLFGNRSTIRRREGALTIRITSSPVYVEGADQLSGFSLGEPRRRGRGRRLQRFLLAFDSLDDWEELGAADPWMEGLTDWPSPCVRAPYLRSNFRLELADDPTFGPVLRVELAEGQPGHPLSVYYAVLRRLPPIALPDDAGFIGAWVRGNSSWGRVLFEVQDSAETRWRSILDDNYLDFDGWRYIETMLPHSHDEERVDPRGHTSWVSQQKDAEPKPPFVLTALIFESRSHVIRATEAVAVPDRTFDVARIIVRRGEEKRHKRGPAD